MKLKVIHLLSYLEKIERDLEGLDHLMNRIQKSRSYSPDLLSSFQRESERLSQIREELMLQKIKIPSNVNVEQLELLSPSSSHSENILDLKDSSVESEREAEQEKKQWSYNPEIKMPKESKTPSKTPFTKPKAKESPSKPSSTNRSSSFSFEFQS